MYTKLNPWKLGLSAGILWGLALFIVTWISMNTGWGMFWLSQWIDIYTGFDITVKGAFIAFGYGLAHGFVAFSLLAWLYNLMRP